MVIRFAKQEDLENISVLYVRNHKATYRGLLSDSYLDALTVESAAAKWKQKMDAEDDCLLIAEQDGSFLGFAAAMPDPDLEQTWYLESLHVAEDARGRGVGTALIREAARHAGEAGFTQMSVCIVRGNERAGALYRKLGAAHRKYFEDAFGAERFASEKLLWETLPE